jgi:hypothetical protein
MDHINILKRAWQILLGCKPLWFFGFLLALTTASSSWMFMFPGGDDPSARYTFSFSLPDGTIVRIPGENQLQWEGGVPEEVVQWLITIGITLLCVVVALIVLRLIVRYLSETALIRMVNEYERAGEMCNVGQGLRLGFSLYAVRFFLIDLVIVGCAVLVFILLFAVSIAPFFLWMTEITALGIIGTVAGIGLFFLFIFLAIVVGAALNLLRDFIKRACAVEDLGVFAAMARGFVLVKRHVRDVGLMWLLMLGIRLGWPIVIFPVALLLISIGLLIAGGIGLLVSGLAGLAFAGNVSAILAGLFGFVVFMLIVGLPLAFLTGLRDTYVSSNWTLTYRDVLALESMENHEVLDLDSLEV